MSSPAPASNSAPIQVKMPDGVTVVHPAGTTVDDALGHAKRYAAAMDPLVAAPPRFSPAPAPSQATIRARTMWDSIDDLRDKVGRVAAKALGLDYDKMADMESRGYSLAMIPLAPSAPAESLMKAEIATPTTPGYMPPRGQGINSLLVDEGGNVYDLGENVHADAMAHLEPGMWKYYAGEKGAANDPDAMVKSLAKNKMLRVQMGSNGRDIAIEAHHAPTPHQLEAIMEMFETHPQALGSYDFTNAAGKNVFDNLVKPSVLVDKIFEHFYPR